MAHVLEVKMLDSFLFSQRGRILVLRRSVSVEPSAYANRNLVVANVLCALASVCKLSVDSKLTPLLLGERIMFLVYLLLDFVQGSIQTLSVFCNEDVLIVLEVVDVLEKLLIGVEVLMRSAFNSEVFWRRKGFTSIL